MADEPPFCDLKNNWVIPRVHAWTVVALLCGTVFSAGVYVTHQLDAFEKFSERLVKLEQQVNRLYCQGPRKLFDKDCASLGLHKESDSGLASQ